MPDETTNLTAAVERARSTRRDQDFGAELSETGWYHSMEFPDGTVTHGHHSIADLKARWAEFGLPDDLSGKRLLDIGAWDGWFSFEAERRGADVVALDYFEFDNFLWSHRKLGSKVRYVIAEVYDLPRSNLGQFDVVLFLGVLYHLRHPLLALECVCAATRELAIVDSFVVSGDALAKDGSDMPYMEFYETTELGNNIDNWVGPSTECLLAFCRSAGFVNVELVSVAHMHARVLCRRSWPKDQSTLPVEGPALLEALHSVNYGLNFSTDRDEYVTCWFDWLGNDVSRLDVRPEVGGYGANPLFVRHETGVHWMCCFRLPPGLKPGWNEVRMALPGTRDSNPMRIAVDMPVKETELILHSAFDGATWEPCHMSNKDLTLCLWVGGLAENCDRHNIRLRLASERLRISYIGDPDVYGLRQINAKLLKQHEVGDHELVVQHGSSSAGPITVRVSEA